MDASAISAVMNMATVQTLNSQSTAEAQSGGGQDFSSMLTSMLGVNAGQQSALNADGTVNYAALLSSMTGGMNLQDVQSQILMQALQDMTKADKPLVTDPALAQLLQSLEGMAGEGAEDADMVALVQQMQDRLRQMMDEQGAQMAGQQAMALVGQLLPVFSPLAGSGVAQALTAAGGEETLNTLLTVPPQQLMQTLSAQGRQTQSTQAQTQQSQTAEVLPQGASTASTAQAQFADVARAAQQPGSTPQGATPPQQVPTVESVQVEGQSGDGEQGLSKLLQTGQAQGSFAGAVRAVKEQMAANDAPKTQDVDVDELQKQVDGTNLTARIQTANITKAAEELRGAQQPVQTQLQQAVAKAIETSQEQITVKLNPEDLGEVTIKMQKADNGGFMLSIIAKNPETQRMLAQEMAQLQQNLRPMKVELEAIVTERQYQMDTASQQFGGQHQRSWQQMHGAAYYGDEPLTTGESASVPGTVIPTAPQSVLNAYV